MSCAACEIMLNSFRKEACVFTKKKNYKYIYIYPKELFWKFIVVITHAILFSDLTCRQNLLNVVVLFILRVWHMLCSRKNVFKHKNVFEEIKTSLITCVDWLLNWVTCSWAEKTRRYFGEKGRKRIVQGEVGTLTYAEHWTGSVSYEFDPPVLLFPLDWESRVWCARPIVEVFTASYMPVSCFILEHTILCYCFSLKENLKFMFWLHYFTVGNPIHT